MYYTHLFNLTAQIYNRKYKREQKRRGSRGGGEGNTSSELVLGLQKKKINQTI
jgi:hypothetical protein